MSNLIQSQVMELPKSPPKTGLVRYNYENFEEKNETQSIKFDKNTFSIGWDDFSQTYASCDVSKPHWELIKEIDVKFDLGTNKMRKGRAYSARELE